MERDSIYGIGDEMERDSVYGVWSVRTYEWVKEDGERLSLSTPGEARMLAERLDVKFPSSWNRPLFSVALIDRDERPIFIVSPAVYAQRKADQKRCATDKIY